MLQYVYRFPLHDDSSTEWMTGRLWRYELDDMTLLSSAKVMRVGGHVTKKPHTYAANHYYRKNTGRSQAIDTHLNTTKYLMPFAASREDMNKRCTSTIQDKASSVLVSRKLDGRHSSRDNTDKYRVWRFAPDDLS